MGNLFTPINLAIILVIGVLVGVVTTNPIGLDFSKIGLQGATSSSVVGGTASLASAVPTGTSSTVQCTSQTTPAMRPTFSNDVNGATETANVAVYAYFNGATTPTISNQDLGTTATLSPNVGDTVRAVFVGDSDNSAYYGQDITYSPVPCASVITGNMITPSLDSKVAKVGGATGTAYNYSTDNLANTTSVRMAVSQGQTRLARIQFAETLNDSVWGASNAPVSSRFWASCDFNSDMQDCKPNGMNYTIAPIPSGTLRNSLYSRTNAFYLEADPLKDFGTADWKFEYTGSNSLDPGASDLNVTVVPMQYVQNPLTGVWGWYVRNPSSNAAYLPAVSTIIYTS